MPASQPSNDRSANTSSSRSRSSRAAHSSSDSSKDTKGRSVETINIAYVDIDALASILSRIFGADNYDVQVTTNNSLYRCACPNNTLAVSGLVDDTGTAFSFRGIIFAISYARMLIDTQSELGEIRRNATRNSSSRRW